MYINQDVQPIKSRRNQVQHKTDGRINVTLLAIIRRTSITACPSLREGDSSSRASYEGEEQLLWLVNCKRHRLHLRAGKAETNQSYIEEPCL
ncbi:hypothetical protein PVAP13_9NG589714 [Panicum virgatum]|uniref:Uncharacterized protein n=1 Tax=Panicum virgatum TaxID=38727 RepID=A0A8T0MZ61_PANVG|nr:hypothetical protein PVAP13_9NG589714 [Panicum virgatum]